MKMASPGTTPFKNYPLLPLLLSGYFLRLVLVTLSQSISYGLREVVRNVFFSSFREFC